MNTKPQFRYQQASKAEQVSFFENNVKAMSEMVERQLEVLDLKPGMKVLDAGTGSGAIARKIALKVSPGTVCGLDVDPFYIEEAARMAAIGGIRNVRFELGDLNGTLKYPDGTFDVCYSRLTMMFVRDPVKTVAELKRVTKIGGVIAVSDNDDGTWLSYPEMPKLWSLWGKYTEWAKAQGEDGRVGRRLFSIFIQSGLSSVRVFGFPMLVNAQSPGLRVWPLLVRQLIENNSEAMIKAGFMTRGECETGFGEIPEFLTNQGSFAMATMLYAVGSVP
jgi:SAM-dependent methyltransferase